MKYAFIEQESGNHAVRRLCRVMGVHPSGFYAWRAEPKSAHQREDQPLQGLLKQAWLESGGGYAYRKLTLDMCDLDERCGKHRVARLLKTAGLRSQSGYGRRLSMRSAQPAVVASPQVQRDFPVQAPNQSWVTDITCICTNEGWLYLVIVLDLGARRVVGCSRGQRIDTRLVLDALTMALGRRRPKQQVLVHSDQGCQLTGHEWQTFLGHHNLLSRISQRSNCHDNAATESFLQLFKHERIKRWICETRQDARSGRLQPHAAQFDDRRAVAGRVRVRAVPFPEAAGV